MKHIKAGVREENVEALELKEIRKEADETSATNGDAYPSQAEDIWPTGDGSMKEYFNDVIESYSAMARCNAQTMPESKACGEMLALCGARLGTMAMTVTLPPEKPPCIPEEKLKIEPLTV